MSIEYDVVVVGCGPVGALAANLLGQAGLSALVLERERDPHPLPRAVHLDHEMMRLLQSVGLIERILPGTREADGHLHVGADRGVIRYMGAAGKARPFGWANDYFFYQPELEGALRDGLQVYPQVKLALGCGFSGLSQDADGVTVAYECDGEERAARASWVIGCDGARSAVRRALGVSLDDLQFEEPWLVIDADVDGPIRFPDIAGLPATADLQRLSVMMCDPSRPATIVPGRGSHRRWELMLLPGESDFEMMQPETVHRLIDPWLSHTSYRLLRAATYRFHGLVAERWRDGRVFLAGDAAHQTPPFFGQGMCHGLRDVANLTWKISLVQAGAAAPGLFDTYQAERDPHVRSVIGAAVDAGRYICVLDKAEAAARDRAIRARKGPDSAADIIPALQSGLISMMHACAGERFIQPRVTADAGDALLDDMTGPGWRAFAIDEADTRAAAELLAQHTPELRTKCFDASGFGENNDLLCWLGQRGLRTVIVRPDFYVFGAASDRAGIEALVAELGGAIGMQAQTVGARVA